MRANKKPTQARDPVLANIEQELCLGRYIRYGDMFDFVRHLEQVEQRLEVLVSDGEADRAVELYEAFLAGCYEKIEECDDSGGYLGMFWDDLFCGWIKARQAAGRPAAETVQQILKWKENDRYGFCYDIESAAVKVLDSAASELFIAHFRKTVDDGLAGLEGQTPRVIFEYENSIRLPAMALKGIYLALGDPAAYAALCEHIGLSPKDCEHLAEIEKAKQRWKQALGWVEKGLELEPDRNWHNEAAFSLRLMKPEILSRLDRKEDALAQAWKDFEKAPSESGYEDFMRYVPKAERKTWHERAMEVAKSGSLEAYMDICVKTKEWTRLANRVHAANHNELEAVSHYQSEAAAEKLVRRDAVAAAKLYRSMGFRIVNFKKSKYYDNALTNFEAARNLYRKAGLTSEWDSLVATVRSNHSRKHGFMTGFERIASGESVDGPSFAERAKSRWASQMGNGGSCPV